MFKLVMECRLNTEEENLRECVSELVLSGDRGGQPEVDCAGESVVRKQRRTT